jgi:glutaredoxin
MPRFPLLAGSLGLALLLAAAPAQALYKVVDADGRITYTDRPPAAVDRSRVVPLRRDGSENAPAPAATAATTARADPALPFELRTIAARWPVVLYTAADCAACDSGRQLLQRRGVPYRERTVASEDDIAMLERLAGVRTVPALTIGAQALRGLNESDWAAYLDAAGYPRESRLPRGWAPPAPVPVVERPAAEPSEAPASPAAPAVGG